MPFLRNCWYVAAWDHEVHRLEMLRRVLLNEPVALYRKTDGTPVALEDRCAHRHAQLSAGKVRGDNVECRYHGFTFDPSGKCVRIPSQDLIPPNARVKSYPVVERNRWIWIWMGDPALADPNLIEDFHWIDDPTWRAKGELLHVDGNYMLIVENLCDLTHLPVLHAASLGQTAIPANELPVKVRREGNGVRVDRAVRDTEPPGYFQLLTGIDRATRVDRWMHLHFTPPAMVRLDIGAAPAGSGVLEGEQGHGYTTRNLNAITPETERSSHYFWAQAQDFGLDNPSIADLDFQLVHKAFQDDLAIIAGQQQNIDIDPGAPRVDVRSDAPGIQARGIVEKLIEAEQAGARRTRSAL
jgi:vanillate O-demethylase monooxygenase subunit